MLKPMLWIRLKFVAVKIKRNETAAKIPLPLEAAGFLLPEISCQKNIRFSFIMVR